VVRLLPLAAFVAKDQKRRRQQWKGREDYRVICDCQRHRRKAIIRRALRIATRGVAVLVSIPLAFSFFDIPSLAMNLDLRATKTIAAPKVEPTNFPVFMTDAVRDGFLDREKQSALTLDVFKEEYFRKHIPYGSIIYREARKQNLPPELVAAMVHTESDFRRDLVSNKSAQGLMQIVPETARLLGVRNPFDPEQNIAAGTKYYRYLLNRFNSETMALAAYNAGEGNVARFGGVPPFGETREYIAKVNRRTSRYRQRVHSTYMAMMRVNQASALTH
jgi:soluble lytic murein transglycosylase-like protein